MGGGQYVRKLTREGREMRRMEASVIPDVYDAMRADERQIWADASDTSHFRAGIESSVADSPADHFGTICTGEIACAIIHFSLQYGGSEITRTPFPENPKSPEEPAITSMPGFCVNFAENEQSFLPGYVSISGVRGETRVAAELIYLLRTWGMYSTYYIHFSSR